MKPCTLIVDGNNLLCRNAFSLKKLTLNDDDATPCGGAWGLLTQVADALKLVQADEVLVCWDGGRSERRKVMFPGYKAHRDTDPKRAAEMRAIMDQWTMVHDVLHAAGAWTYKAAGVEADDVIALLAMATVAQDREAVILSNDGDFLQLVSPGISLLKSADKHVQYGKCNPVMIGEAALTTKCIMGCSSDGIPGIVPGMGEARTLALRESVLADSREWNVATIIEILKGDYHPPEDPENRNLKDALSRVTCTAEGLRDMLRNVYLCNLHASVEWPEVGAAAMNPTFHENPGETALEEKLDGLGWKPEGFAPLSVLWR